jgi:hypothetical protein
VPLSGDPVWGEHYTCVCTNALFQAAIYDLRYQPEANGWYFFTTMTNEYSLPTAEEAAALPPPAKRRRLRSLFWPGFVVGFLLLSIASCGGIVLATGISRLDLTDLQNNGQVWSPPLVTPTAVVTPAAEEPVGEAGGAFRRGDQLHNITSSMVNIRAVPGYLSKPQGDVTGQVPPGGLVEVTGGRAFADGLTWWLIRHSTAGGSTIDGWIAEATASGVQILGQ